MSKLQKRGYVINTAVLVVLFALFMLISGSLGGTDSFKLILVPSIWQCCYLIILAASLNLVLGFLGQLSLGHCGFMAIGAYTAGADSIENDIHLTADREIIINHDESLARLFGREDIENLKIKVDAGVTHLISQLFYDNEDFYRFLDKARAAGITVPIEAGIMPVRGAKSVRRMAERNASRIPDRLNTLLNKWGDDIQSLRAAGILYASEQIADLVAHDVDGVHLYSMNHPATTRRIWRNAEPLFRGTQG